MAEGVDHIVPGRVENKYESPLFGKSFSRDVSGENVCVVRD